MPTGVYKRKKGMKTGKHMLGRVIPQETRDKMSKALKGRIPKNIKNIAGWNKGKKGLIKATPERIEKMKIIAKERGYGKWMKFKTEENANNWKGGVTRDRHGNTQNRVWRSQVFERDNWTCQTCRERGCYMEAHHIKSWAKYPELRYDLSNGVTLCLPCHKLTDNYKGKARKK